MDGELHVAIKQQDLPVPPTVAGIMEVIKRELLEGGLIRLTIDGGRSMITERKSLFGVPADTGDDVLDFVRSKVVIQECPSPKEEQAAGQQMLHGWQAITSSSEVPHTIVVAAPDKFAHWVGVEDASHFLGVRVLQSALLDPQAVVLCAAPASHLPLDHIVAAALLYMEPPRKQEENHA